MKVPEGLNLEWLAASQKMPGRELADLNPELRTGVTSPDQKEYLLRVPVKKKRQAKRLARLSFSANKNINDKFIKLAIPSKK